MSLEFFCVKTPLPWRGKKKKPLNESNVRQPSHGPDFDCCVTATSGWQGVLTCTSKWPAVSSETERATPWELGRVCGTCRPVQKTPKNVYLPIKLLPRVPTGRRNLSEDTRRCHLITQRPHPWSYVYLNIQSLSSPLYAMLFRSLAKNQSQIGGYDMDCIVSTTVPTLLLLLLFHCTLYSVYWLC